jgi:ABC-type lipoprotein export system ATPase subunit
MSPPLRIDLAILPGEVVAIIGPTGAGKSAILDLAAGFDRPNAGTVGVFGRVVASAKKFVDPHLRGIAYLVQGLGLWEDRSARENVRIVAAAAKSRRSADDLLDHFGFRSNRDLPAARLSGGERQIVALARVFAVGAPIVLLDEPGAHLDQKTRSVVFAALDRIIAEQPMSVLIAAHSKADLAGLRIDRWFALESSRLTPFRSSRKTSDHRHEP